MHVCVISDTANLALRFPGCAGADTEVCAFSGSGGDRALGALDKGQVLLA